MGVVKRGNKLCNGDGLASKVTPFYPFKDAQGEFICYCDYRFHKGFVLKPNVCETRQCSHYFKFYINGNNFFSERRTEQTVTRQPYRPCSGRNGHQ
jgi:hypothetical protein